MRTKQSIVRILMAAVIMCGTATTASAQFGALKGLANKAKKAMTKEQPQKEKETVEKEETVTTMKRETPTAKREVPTTKPKEKVMAELGPGEPGVVTIKARKTGKVLGTYDREACKLTAGNKTFVFHADGTVTYGNGTKIGSIDGQTFTTPRGEQLKCDEIGIIFVDKQNVGAVSNPKMAILGDGSFIDVSDKMNPVVLGYFIFAIMHNNKQLVDIKKGYQAATMTENPTDEEFYAQLNKEAEKRFASSSSTAGGDMQLRKGGSIVGSILANGTVYVGGHIAGKIDRDGNIYVGGHIEGSIRNNEILKNGHVIGTVDSDGTVRLDGHIVGGIDSRTGEVRKNGSIIGRAEPLTDMKKAAVFYFFGFF